MKSFEKRPSIETPEKSYEQKLEEHENKFRERLVKLAPDFLEARKKWVSEIMWDLVFCPMFMAEKDRDL